LSFVDRIAECNVFDPAGYVPFRVDGADLGLVHREFVDRLRRFPDVFRVDGAGVVLDGRLIGFEARTAAVDAALRDLRGEGAFVAWRDEAYPVAESFSAPPVFAMERAAVPRFGVRGYGVHLNGYVRDGDRLKMWIARRAMDKALAPGKLDQIVAGGQPADLTLRRNLVKEAAEEADIPAGLAARAVGVSAVSYCTERAEGLRRDVEFIYDLELPRDFTPRNTDGEVGSFELWPIEEVAATVRDTDAFKFNCALVVIDFLIRHGLIEPDHPEFVDLIAGLRRG